MPGIRHRVKELFCTQDGLAGISPMEDRWKAPRTNSPAAEGEQHVTSRSRDAPGSRTQQTAGTAAALTTAKATTKPWGLGKYPGGMMLQGCCSPGEYLGGKMLEGCWTPGKYLGGMMLQGYPTTREYLGGARYI